MHQAVTDILKHVFAHNRLTAANTTMTTDILCITAVSESMFASFQIGTHNCMSVPV